MSASDNAERRTSVLTLAYLVPFFLIRSLNVLPWPGEPRQSANDTNGAMVLSLLDMAVLHCLWVTVAIPVGASYPTSPFPVVIIFILLAVSHVVWLTTKRSKQLSRDFRRLSRRTRLASLVGSLAAFALAVAGFFVMTPLRP